VRHVFVTSRAEPIPRWLQAFPDAVVLHPDAAGLLQAIADAPVVWLHAAQSDFPLAERVAALRTASPCPVVVLSNVPEDDQGLAALTAGAAGYCSALTLPEVLHQVADVVVRGGLWIGPQLMQRLMHGLAAPRGAEPTPPTLDELSQRERQIAGAAARGSTNKEIARTMGITERTVKAHLSAAYEKLGVRDRMQLALLLNGVGDSTLAPQKISA
jgi:DNA-binding NarL/FixJ family response regulator